MPPNCRSPVWRDTPRIRLPSRTHDAAARAEAQVLELAEGLLLPRHLLQRRRDELAERHLDTISRIAARNADSVRRSTETPVARITVISLPRASDPSPISEPISAMIGSSSQACCGRLSSTNQNASSGGEAADADVVLLADEQEQRAEHQRHGHHQRHRPEDRANDVAVEDVHAALVRYRRRVTPRGPMMTTTASSATATCTHHRPTNSGTVPRASQTFPVETRFEYTK